MTDTEAFFLESGSDQLKSIYQWARARYAAPWAVFFAVLLRVAASVGPHVQLPGIIGGRASLNLLCAFVSPSGGGKGISDKVGRLAWPAPVLELPIGSGEGIAETFTLRGKESEDNERITAAIFNCSEIDILTGLESRQGSTILGTLKAFAMGEQFGSTNATKGNSRNVPAHSYRGCLSVGAQPGHTGVIFNDVTGGTPQRFLWALTIDPLMPATATPDPDPLDTTMPKWKPGADGVAEIIYGHDEITETVIAAHLARQRGEADALDGHAMLTRLKVAALLAIMHGRSVVSEWDWQRSGDVMAVSHSTRDWIVEQAKIAARAKVRERAMARAKGEEFVSDHKLQRAKSAVLRWLQRDGELASNQLRSKLKADLRDHFGAAVAELAAEGWITEIQVDRGVRYRVDTEVQGVPDVQGQSSQLSKGVPEVQGVPEATITDLDSRRSHEVERPKLSCQKWFNNYIAELRAAGHTTAESFAINRAGEAAGYTQSNLSKAASAHPDVVAIARTSRGATWSITGDRQSAYVPATDFFAGYLSNLPPNATQIDQDDYQRASAAAGYGWEAAAKAATKHPRIGSVPAAGNSRNDRIWLIKPEADEGAAS
ncbi:hypothetical protein MAHJHV49_22940 [Mycobacterium avium subsp. hominissuis]|uniref:DUF3987 domain-containing protein n=1 Tax=Mycobacterium alsense TaxID=324058 RepID=A0AA41XUR4_9MYCO|nr:hypothetical protein [Mycobacterium alsense]MCV7382177.1 hypothetical protein [Mycobacterium alsense]OQZ90375.1 hypothetical protein BST11_13415 [Mycobacterium alsense]